MPLAIYRLESRAPRVTSGQEVGSAGLGPFTASICPTGKEDTTVPTHESVLHDKTYTEEGLAVARRVFYTLAEDKRSQPALTTKGVALLVELLAKKGVLSGDDVDELLFTCAMGAPSGMKPKSTPKKKPKTTS